jgi:hypothetical protein
MNDVTNISAKRGSAPLVRRQIKLFGSLLGGFTLLLLLSFGLEAWLRHVAPGGFAALLDTVASLARSFAILGLMIASLLALISFGLSIFFPAKEKP